MATSRNAPIVRSLLLACLGSLLVAGCGSSNETQVAPQDKSNIERLAKEGIGAPPADER